MSKRIVVVGGSDAGISAALRARQVDPTAEVDVVVADAFPNYSICGLPFYLSGEVRRREDLAHRTADDIRAAGVRLHLDTRAVGVEPSRGRITVVGPDGEGGLPYDALVLGTGARPRPARDGIFEHPAVHPLHAMDTAFRALEALDRSPRRAVVVGSGYIGLEMADALRVRGVPEVTLLGRSEAPLSTVHPSLGALVRDALEARGVHVVDGVEVQDVDGGPDGTVRVRTPHGDHEADFVLMATGVEPETALGRDAGIGTGVAGALRADRSMRTTVDGVLAAGDCVETWHRIVDDWVWLPLGTTAHKQGRVAGATAAGVDASFAGVVGTQVVKVFDLAIGRTGLREAEARNAGFDPVSVAFTGNDHKAYYPGATETVLRILGDRRTGRLLGAQLAGHWRSGVAKRLDVFASALHQALPVAAILDLDLSYTPPLGSPWDVIQMAADAWLAQAGRP